MKRSFLMVLTQLLISVPCFAAYNLSVVDFPGATQTIIFAVNDRGHYVGAFADQAGSHAMYYDGQSLQPLDPIGVVGKSAKSHAYSLNTWDAIAGSYTDASGVLHGFVMHHGQLTHVDYPGGFPTEAYGINDLGRVIGVYYTADGNFHAFTLDNGVYRATDIAGAVTTIPLSINDRDQVVGEVIDVANTVGHGFTEQCDGAITRYDAPGAPANSTFFISINNLDQILGAYFDAAGNQNNFLLERGTLVPFTLPASFGATYISAQTINDWGAIVGFYTDGKNVNHGFIARPVPTP
jgi:probable HAF family extracellular repeat protein